MARRQPPVLVLGNGPNRVQEDGMRRSYSWRGVLESLREYVGVEKEKGLNRSKPFPLYYEELLIAGRLRGLKERSLKRFIAEKMRLILSTPLLEGLVSVGFTDILTTNYDHAIEVALGARKGDFVNRGLVSESRYNLFRHHVVSRAGVRVWHIHGDMNEPSTITLGYEHYSGYLQKMRTYTLESLTYKGVTLEPSRTQWDWRPR